MIEEHRWRVNVMIRHLALRHRNEIQRRLEAELGIHVGQELILMVLNHRGAMVQSEMLPYLSVEPPTLSIIARKMESAGLISRSRSEHDSRAQVLSLTEKGREMIPAIYAIENDVAQRLTHGMSSEEFEQGLEFMRTAMINLDGHDARQWADKLMKFE